MFRLTVMPLALLLAPAAHAVVFVGNPTTKVTIEHPSAAISDGDVWLDSVTVDYCDGTAVDHQANVAIDPVDGFTFSPDAGDICTITLNWGANLAVDGTGVSGPFEIESWDMTTEVTVVGAYQSAPLVGWSVVDGTGPSEAPLVVITMD